MLGLFLADIFALTEHLVSFPDYRLGGSFAFPALTELCHCILPFSFSPRERKVFLLLLVAGDPGHTLFSLNCVHTSVSSPFIQVSSVEPSAMDSVLGRDPN